MILAMMAAMAMSVAADGPKPAERARANLSEYFSADDYPESSARRGIEGTTGFRLDIDAEGRVTNCVVTRSSGDLALDTTTCSVLLSRAEYRPARDRGGRAIASSDEGRVTWRLPTEAPPAPEPFASVRAPVSIDLSLGVDARRRQTCTVLVNGASDHPDGRALCSLMERLAGYDGGEGVMAGAPAEASVTIGITVGLEGAMPAAGNLDRGMLLIDGTARLSVGADGRVAECTVTETNYHGGMPAESTPLDLCGFPAFRGKMFPAVPEGGAPRTGRIHFEFHLRVGPARAA